MFISLLYQQHINETKWVSQDSPATRKTATIMAAAYEDSCIVLKVVIPLLQVLRLVRVRL